MFEGMVLAIFPEKQAAAPACQRLCQFPHVIPMLSTVSMALVVPPYLRKVLLAI